jgi:glycosyltransferase involved in cell wall biosynthesis
LTRPQPKIAIVHDWLYTYAGAERVLEQFLNIWPDADIYTLFDFLPDGKRFFLHGKSPSTTFIQRLPFAKTLHRQYLPFFPMAIEQLDLRGYDVVVSVHYCAANGVITGPDQYHLSYCCSPMRYAWDLQHQYLRETGLDKGVKTALARLVLHYLRTWDTRASNGVDEFLTLSKFVSRRIEKAYRRPSEIVWAPVDVSRFEMGREKSDYYVTASRMVPYKRIDLIVEAFTRMPDKKLVVIGEGPEFAKVKSLAGPNVQILGYQPYDALKHHLQAAKAFVFAAEEDFGIAPLEAQACGTPVLAFGRGGATETIVGFERRDPTGHFFEEQTVEGIIRCVGEFEEQSFRCSPEACRSNAERFSPDLFRSRVASFFETRYDVFRSTTQRR